MIITIETMCIPGVIPLPLFLLSYERTAVRNYILTLCLKKGKISASQDPESQLTRLRTNKLFGENTNINEVF